MGQQKGIEKIINELNQIIKEKENQLKLKDKDIENVRLSCDSKLEKQILICKLEIKDKDLLIKDKDLEILKLKNKLLLNNIKIE
jgi:hypothetical protein